MTYKFVGLTDEPERQRAEHGNPSDWSQLPFFTEAVAREWERVTRTQPGYMGGTKETGWRYGYIYTITPDTQQ
jgi:hypothetical protein